MQACASHVVSEFAVVVLVLDRSLANAAHGSYLVAYLYSTQPAQSPARPSTTIYVPKCYENDSRN